MLDAADKTALRAAALDARAAVLEAAADAFGRRLARLGPDLAHGAAGHVVSVFWSIGSEVSTRPLMEALHAAGFAVALPVAGRKGTPLTFRRWTPETIMVPGRMAIPEPPPEADILKPDVLFVPLAAYDRRGHRIGYGAGFYDRSLAALRAEKQVTAIGVAYAAQEALFIPSEEHDETLDLIVTDTDTLVIADEA